MDSARGFCLLGESVPQVGVSARTLAPFGDFSIHIFLTPFFFRIYFLLFGTMDLAPQPFDWMPFGSGEKGQPHHGFGVSSVRVNIFQ